MLLLFCIVYLEDPYFQRDTRQFPTQNRNILQLYPAYSHCHITLTLLCSNSKHKGKHISSYFLPKIYAVVLMSISSRSIIIV